MKIAIHTKIDFKPDSSDLNSFSSLANDFENVDLSIEETAIHIGLGHSICTQHKGKRSRNNFIASDFVAVDIDGGMTIEQAMNDPYVIQYAGIIYPTWNNTPSHNRFRIVFFLEKTIQDANTMESAYTGLIRMFGGDGACKDACRIFYGNKKALPIILGNTLPNDLLDELIKLGSEKRERAEHGENDSIKSGASTTRAEQRLRADYQVETIAGSMESVASLKKGSIVRCPFHIDKSPSAFVTESRNGTKGIHCSSCAKTFWPEAMNFRALQNYDFNQIESDLHAIEFEEDPCNYLDEKAPSEFFTHDGRMVLPGSNHRLNDIELGPGIILIRSPKDSGKTHQLKRMVQECKINSLSVLLIGHRQSLISSLAKRIGLDCYLDKKDSDGNAIAVSDYYAICLDSIPRLLNLRVHRFDVVIIDESEQVFSHLTSETLRKQRRDCFLMMERYLEKAKTVIACDADLGYLTLTTIASARGGEMPAKFYINRHKENNPEIDLYNSENQLLSELITAVRSGGKYYVCCNSKKKAQLIENSINAETSGSLRVLLITSTNSKEPEIRNFIENISEEILKYDVVVSSPSLGTGIDITFAENEKLIDGVFGFFGARINTHFDIDQQLCRVRHPKFVKAWISPEKFTFEIEPDVIKRNCIELGQITDVQISYDANDMKIYADDDKLLTLYAEVLSLQRASKNNLKQHFIDLKNHNGWQVNIIETDETASVIGRDARKEARLNLERNNMSAICSAPQISKEVAVQLAKLPFLNLQDQAKLDRYQMEKFYDEIVTPTLVKLDNNGTYRTKIHFLAIYIASDHGSENQNLSGTKISVSERELLSKTKSLLSELFDAAKLIDQNGNFIEDKAICNADLESFKSLCLQRKFDIESLLKMSLRADLQIKPIAQLGELLRAIGCEWKKPMKTEIKGKNIIYYAINYDAYKMAMKYAKGVNDHQTFLNELSSSVKKKKVVNK